nr:MAG TPA: hypothetical protein [Caudoviricetes sp.]
MRFYAKIRIFMLDYAHLKRPSENSSSDGLFSFT